MFLHIGNNIVIKKEEIIGIYNIKSIKDTIEYKDIINKLKLENNLIKAENIEENTFILIQKNNEIKGYISNISSNTLSKRMENM